MEKEFESVIKMMDKDPNNIEYVVEHNLDRFLRKNMCIKAFEKNPLNIRFIPKKFITQEMCDAVFELNRYNIMYILEEFITQEMCDKAIATSTYLIRYVPEKFITQEMCDKAFETDCQYIQYIPPKFITQEMCDKAFETNYQYIRYIPQKFITQEMCARALKKDFANIQYIPEEFITKKMCDKVIKANPVMLAYIPQKFITQEMCDKAFETNPIMLAYIPQKFITQEMCDKAIETNPIMLAYMPEEFITQEMCDKVIDKDISNKRFINDQGYFEKKLTFSLWIPQKFINAINKKKIDIIMNGTIYLDWELIEYELKQIASNFESSKMMLLKKRNEAISNVFKRNPNNVKYIHVNFRTQEMWNKSFELNPNNIRCIPEEFITQEMCDRAFESNHRNIMYIPEQFITQEMCDRAFESNHHNIMYMPEEFITQEMCDIVFESNHHDIIYIPEQFITQEMYNAIFISSKLYEIPKKFITPEMCSRAFKLDPNNIRYIPEEFITQEMSNKLFEINIDNISIIPDRFKTYEMCYSAFITNYENLKHIPENYRKKIFIDVLKKDVYKYSKIISEFLDKNSKNRDLEIYDIDIISVVFIELKKIIEQGKKIPDDSKLCSYVVGLYPELKDVIDIPIDDKIKDDLYALISNRTSIEFIAKKHQVTTQEVYNILEKIKIKDKKSYEAIKEVLAHNQNNYFFDIMNDVYKLGEIILSLGFVNTKFLNIEQKVKFAYLYNKHVHHSLEEIYNFNYKKYDNKYAKVLDRFFKGILKYNYLADDYTMLPEKKTILFNNSWLKKYDRNKFFGIKNGIPTIESKFGQNQTVLTLEIEQGIINILKENEIPLIDVIVRTAFKEYFNGTLSEYITKIKEYDTIFENNKHKKL